jgi:D-sedoheptulose 7-phosphate isomerase
VKGRLRADRDPFELQARTYLRETGRSILRLERSSARAVAAAARAVVASLEAGGTVYLCGNGGSAADAQHLACELAGRFMLERPGLAAVALTTNTSSLTAIGNDYAFEQVFSRQLEGLGVPGDVLVALSTSGTSPNVLRAVETARRLGMTVIGMTGGKGKGFAARCDLALVTPSVSTPHVQEGHIAMGHALCALVERALLPSGTRVGRRRASRAARPRRARRR